MSDDLAARVASRICHDLVNPLGAVSNGVELLSMSGAASGPEMALVQDSLSAALARVNLFRIAFGAPAPGQTVAGKAVVEMLTALAPSMRVSVTADLPAEVERDRARVLLLLMQCCESAMPFGGDIVLTPDSVQGRAKRMTLDPGHWAHLSDGRVADIPANAVHFALARRALPASATVATTEGEITIRL
ncbi:MAG: histidine phosphotransferase family protein [Shimia sp.]